MEEKVHFSLKTCLGLFCKGLLHEKQTTQTNIKKHRFCIPGGFCQFRDFSFSAMCPTPYKIKEVEWAAGNAPAVLSSRALVLAAAAQGALGFSPDQAWESQGAFPLRVPKGILFLDNLDLQKHGMAWYCFLHLPQFKIICKFLIFCNKRLGILETEYKYNYITHCK